MLRFLLPALAILPWALKAQAGFVSGPSAVAGKSYDFIVVGGGLGGVVVASRLSEISSFKVLLIEAGPSDLDYPNIPVPLNASQLFPGTALNWNYSYVPTRYVDNRAIPVLRGHVLGGSTSINFLLQNKGSVEFWNQFANFAGDSSYTMSNMARYLLKYEGFTPPVDGHNPSGEYDASRHSTTGPVKITTYNYKWDTYSKVISAAGQVPGWQLNHDPNTGNMLGLSTMQVNQGTGVRYSSSESYIHANGALSRNNLDILVSTLATKLIISNSTSVPRITGVEFSAGPNSPKYVANATREVIVAAGAFNTPALLQLSGIGDPTHLASLGIRTVVPRPDVGKNLQDHPLFLSYYTVNTTNTFDPISRGDPIAQIDSALWNKNHTGPMSNIPASTWAFGRAPLDGNYDPSPGGNSPHWEHIYTNGFIGPAPATGNYMSIFGVLLTEEARGTVLINSTSPFALPLVDSQWLNNPWDVATFRYIFKAARKFVENAPALKGYVLSRYGNQVGVETDDQIDEFIRQNVGTCWHPTSSAVMSKAGTPDGVVDPKFKVKGTANLRIVDASIFPRVPSGHPMGMLYALSEKASDIIKAANGH